ncbi:MAG TPA: MBL fold metallo-hydrolase [Acidimicrobiales bacterium]|nr:MBL fold metallo-hydrolase [Acidimicrobiales bacterium]
MTAGAGFEQVAEGVHVHTSARAMTTTTVVELTRGTCLVVDPAMEPPDLAAVADFTREAGLEVAAGWSTHAHWDHVLWSRRLGPDVPRFAVRDNVETCRRELAELRRYIEQECPGHDLELCGILTDVADSGGAWPLPTDRAVAAIDVEVVEHRAHAPGHAGLFLAPAGVLIAGDMVSDIEIPSLDLEARDPLSDYEEALRLYARLAPRVEAFIPGHGTPGGREELLRRIDLDRRYLDDLASGRPVAEERMSPAWLRHQHALQVEWVRSRS